MQSEQKVNGVYADVSPEDLKEDVNYAAFQDEGHTTQDIFPAHVMSLLEDRSNWKNREAGITEILKSVREVEDASLLQANSEALLSILTNCLNDSHFKIVLHAHEVLEEIITKIGPAVTQSLKPLVGCLVSKMGDNKFATKQASMKIFMQLMQLLKPHPVVSEVLACGLRHKISRVREETINVVIASLLTFPRTEFDLLLLAKEIAPCLVDNKQRVRQASLEMFALLAHSLGKGHVQPLVSAVASVERSYFGKELQDGGKIDNGISLQGVMIAFQARLARRQLAHLNSDGLVVHAISVTGSSRGSVLYSGADVDWILAAGNSGINSCTPSAVRRRSSLLSELQNDPSGANTSQGITPVLTFRPYRSAGKRLPWEIDSQGNKETVKDEKPRNLAAIVPSKARIPSTMVSSTNGSTNPNLNPRGVSYAKQHLAKLKTNQELSLGGENDKLTTSLNGLNGQATIDTLPTRHSSLPSDLDSSTRSLLTNGSLLHSSQHNDVFLQDSNSLSLSWPNKRHPPSPGRKIPLPLKNHSATTACDTTAAATLQHSVKPTIGRPTSKIRAHNPLLNSIKSSGDPAAATSSSGNPSPVDDSVPRRNSKIRSTIDTELLKNKVQIHNGLPSSNKVRQLDGLMRNSPDNWADDFEEIYDDEFEGNSLCSSAASLLCKDHDATKSGDFDKLRLLRRQAASKKARMSSDPAMLDSTDSLPATNSPHSDSPEQEGVGLAKWPQSRDHDRSNKLPEKVNHKAHQTKTRSADTIKTTNKTKPTPLTTSTTIASNSDVKVENISPDTSPSHHHTTAAGGNTGDDKTVNQDTAESQHHNGIANRRARSDTDRVKVSRKPKNETEDAAAAKSTAKSIPQLKEKQKVSGYAARYSQQRKATENSNNSVEKETLNALRVLDLDRPLLSPATKESMAKKRRCSEKLVSTDSTTQDNSITTTSVSAPVRRSKQSGSLGSEDERHSASVTFSDTTDSTNHTAAMSGEQHELLSLEELRPFQNPEQALRECTQSLANPDWNAKCGGLLAVRRLGAFHPEVLAPQFHVMVLSVLEEVKNLRSQVSRAAISCMADLFSCCGRMMDQDLEVVVKVLLHKAGESSVFIREDAERALAEMVSVVTPTRCLVALVNGGLHHRSVTVKRSMSCFISVSLEKLGAGKFLHSSKDVLDKVLPALVQLTTDPSPEARYYARWSLNLLLSHPDFDKTTSRVFTTQRSLAKCKEVIDNLKNKGVGDFPTDTQSAKKRSLTGSFGSRTPHPRSHESRSGPKTTPNHKQRHSAGSILETHGEQTVKKPARKLKSQGQGKFCTSVELPVPGDLLTRLKSSEWKERYEGVTELERFVDNNPAAIGSHVVKVFDAFLPRLTDSNSKVNLHALEAFSNMVPLLGDLLLPIVTNVVEALGPNLASKQAMIHDTAETVLELITQCITPAPLAQPIANAAQYGNSRIQPIMLERLAYLVPFIQNQRPQTVIRHMLPVLFHFVAAKMPPTGPTRLSLLMLCAALDSCLRAELFEHAHHLPPEQMTKLKELVNSATKS